MPSYLALATAGRNAPAPFTVTEHAAPLALSEAIVDSLSEAFASARDLPVPMPIALRSVGADDALLSPYSRRPVITVSAAAPSSDEAARVFGLVHNILVTYGARPHWGKEHLYSAEDLRGLYPDLRAFDRIRRRFDPRGVFFTPELRDIVVTSEAPRERGDDR